MWAPHWAFHGLQAQCSLSSGETKGTQQNENRKAPKEVIKREIISL